MRVDTKPVKTGITRILGKSGKLVFQTNLNYLDLGDVEKQKQKQNPQEKNSRKKPTSCQS